MADPERMTAPVIGGVLVSYVLGELDADEQAALEKKLAADPALTREVGEIRRHLKLHQDVRKVAPRRGSFERLVGRMKREGAMDAAVPGVHCMLRRAFLVAGLFGALAVALLAMFGVPGDSGARPDVIGQIVYHNPSLTVGQRRAEVERTELVLFDEARKAGAYDTGAYDAYLWLPTGQMNTYSTIEAGTATEFRFLEPRHMEIARGELRRVQVRPGGIGEGAFVLSTPHCRIEVEDGSLSVAITRDSAETRISVGEGSARVFGQDSDRSFRVTAGWCTSVEKGKLPNPARPMLELLLQPRAGSEFEMEATLVNSGFVPVRITRAYSTDPVYLLHVMQAADFDADGRLPENANLPPMPVTPKPDPSETAADHRGDWWLDPGKYYRFTFDVSALLLNAPKVEYWLRLEYRGDLYGPPGEAKVKIHSANQRLDMRNR